MKGRAMNGPAFFVSVETNFFLFFDFYPSMHISTENPQ
jgi:hypothetical protein